MWPADLQIYYHHHHALVPVGPMPLLHDRPLIPVNLRQEMMDHLHAGHAGATGMFARASNSVYWPNMRTDLVRHRVEFDLVQKKTKIQYNFLLKLLFFLFKKIIQLRQNNCLSS